ncbi:phospholipase [Actinoplanes sp. GCM10030250]|uniref:phospholipase n=1 Tax=Actinoplanes sp. GCM10030250 TaxID=3273376 RepID=UPI00360F1593
MTRPAIRRAAVAGILLAGTTILPAGPAWGVVPDKGTLLARWTQPTAESTAEWNAARRDRGKWAEYGFDWSTDYCSHGPEKPVGFDFRNACRHHDFGYRNYRAAGTFAAHKRRIDEVFRADLRRTCDGYRTLVQPVCNTVAWTYYQATVNFGDR